MLSFMGDVYLDKPYKLDFQPMDFIFNLEFPLSTDGVPAKDKVNLGQNKNNIFKTFRKLPKSVCLANNHIFDYSDKAFEKTIDILRNDGIGYFGAGCDANNFNNPYIYEGLRQFKIAVSGYCCDSTHPSKGKKYRVAPINLELIKQDIAKANENRASFIVVQLHWGEEEIIYPKASDIKLAKDIIDLGADLIIGHHAHVIQSKIEYKDKNIFFGLGNFIFPDINEPAYFNGNDFETRYKKKQNKRNRRSVVVNVDSDLNVSYFGTFFDKKKVFVKDFKLSGKTLPQKKFEKHYRAYIRLQKIKNFIKNPQLLSFERLVRFFKG